MSEAGKEGCLAERTIDKGGGIFFFEHSSSYARELDNGRDEVETKVRTRGGWGMGDGGWEMEDGG